VLLDSLPRLSWNVQRLRFLIRLLSREELPLLLHRRWLSAIRHSSSFCLNAKCNPLEKDPMSMSTINQRSNLIAAVRAGWARVDSPTMTTADSSVQRAEGRGGRTIPAIPTSSTFIWILEISVLSRRWSRIVCDVFCRSKDWSS
jgi:hypothetical protein